jgi:hypothetical protein
LSREAVHSWVGKGFYAAGFDALVKRWDKWIGAGGEIDVFFQGSNITYFTCYIHLWPFTVSLSLVYTSICFGGTR